MSEADTMREIQLHAHHDDARFFRNNVGVFPTADGRMVSTGLCVGSSDLIGWRSIEITKAMVGRRIAIFVAIEVKDKSKTTKAQLSFLNAVAQAGGLAGVAHSWDEAHTILQVGK